VFFSLSALDLAFWDYSVLHFICVCAFVVLDLVVSVLCQEIGWKVRL